MHSVWWRALVCDVKWLNSTVRFKSKDCTLYMQVCYYSPLCVRLVGFTVVLVFVGHDY